MSALMSFAPLLPEIVLACGAMALLMLGAFQPESDSSAQTSGWLAIGILVAAAFLVAQG